MLGLGRVFRHNKRVFLAPPWPEIYTSDQERRHDFAEVVAVCPALEYDIHVLPKVSAVEGANRILASSAS